MDALMEPQLDRAPSELMRVGALTQGGARSSLYPGLSTHGPLALAMISNGKSAIPQSRAVAGRIAGRPRECGAGG